MSVTANGDRTALAALLTGGVLAGGNVVAVVFSNKELAALWGAGLRFAAAAAVLLVIMAVMGLGLPRGRALAGAVLYGLLNFGAAFGLAYYTLSHMQAGLASTLLALVPLTTLMLAVAQRQERLRASALGGGLLAVAGVGLISNVSLDRAVPPLALLAGLGAVLCMAQAAIVVRRFPPVHPVTMNAVGMVAGAALLLAGSVLAGDPRTLPQQGQTWFALAYLVLLGSIGVFMLFLIVLRFWAASRAVYLDLMIPPVAVLLSVWLDNEPVTAGLLAGGLLILAGVYVGAVRPRGPVTRRVGEPATSDVRRA